MASQDGLSRTTKADPGFTLEEMKQFVRNHFEEFVNRKKLDIADVNFAPEFVDHGTDTPPGVPRDGAGMKQYVGGVQARIPDLHVDVLDVIAEGDKVVVHNRWTAPTRPPTARWHSVASLSGALLTANTSSAGRIWKRRTRLTNVSSELPAMGVLGPEAATHPRTPYTHMRRTYTHDPAYHAKADRAYGNLAHSPTAACTPVTADGATWT